MPDSPVSDADTRALPKEELFGKVATVDTSTSDAADPPAFSQQALLGVIIGAVLAVAIVIGGLAFYYLATWGRSNAQAQYQRLPAAQYQPPGSSVRVYYAPRYPIRGGPTAESAAWQAAQRGAEWRGAEWRGVMMEVDTPQGAAQVAPSTVADPRQAAASGVSLTSAPRGAGAASDSRQGGSGVPLGAVSGALHSSGGLTVAMVEVDRRLLG